MSAISSLLSLWRPQLRVGATPADVVWRENKWRLLHYRMPGPPRFATPVLLVPSLINRSYVLDLLPGKSFAEDLALSGHDVYSIDWGTPGDEDRYLGFDDFADRYLARAIRQVARRSPRGQTHVLGYCLGGTLAAIHAAVHPERIASLVALAAPITFHDQGLLSRWTRTRSFDVGAMVEACGNVPAQLMQSAFQMLRPTQSLLKAVHFVDRMWDDEYLDGFFALEAWGSDNVPFPGEVYRRYVEELYRADSLAGGTFTLSGRAVDLGAIRCPLLVVTFEHDHIVPWQSAAALLERAGSADKERVHLLGGHVGAVVSRHAKRSLWPRLRAFWSTRDQPAAAPLRPAPPARPVPMRARAERAR